MAYGLSNGHVTDDVTWPWKAKLGTPIRLERNISKTAGGWDSVPKDHQQETTYGVSNGHVTEDVTWPPKVPRGSTVGYLSDSLASCSLLMTAKVVPAAVNKHYALCMKLWWLSHHWVARDKLVRRTWMTRRQFYDELFILHQGSTSNCEHGLDCYCKDSVVMTATVSFKSRFR